MRNKKQKDEAELNPDQQLEERVDAMMDLRREEPPVDKPEPEEKEPAKVEKNELPAIDIFSETKTAPKLPGDEESEVKEKAKPKEPAKEEKTEEILTDTAPEEAEPEIAEEADAKLDPAKSLDELSTDAAIDNIVKSDLDKVLEAEDATAQKHVEKKRRSSKGKFRDFFSAWWHNPWARWGTVIGILAVLVGLAVWPTSRYFALNTFGVRGQASIKVVDSATELPLKNVTVQLGSNTAKTDEKGEVKFTFLRLGNQQLKVERVAFASVDKPVTISWGSNSLGNVPLKATGAQYVFEVTDYLSNKPVNAEAVSGAASAFADKNGKIILTVENPETETLEVSIQASEYRTEKLSFAADTKDVFSLKAVPDHPVVYVTKESGTYDIYKMDIDGKNKQLLLAGTGRERQTMSVVASPDGTQAAVVSSRGTTRDQDGYLLDSLTLITLKDASTTVVDEAESIRFIDWQGKRLVYTANYGAPSAATEDRQRIIAYNTEENARAILANSDYFNGVISANGFVYYAIANSDPKQAASFSRIKLDGSGKQVLLNKQVWAIQRTDKKRLSLQTPEGWYNYTIGSGTPQKGDPPPETYAERQYVADRSSTRLAWVENRDGKGVLIVHEANASKDETVVSASGVTGPVRWLNSTTLLYRVVNSNETAEYVKSTEGGDAKKLTDITPVTGFSVN